MRAVVTDEAGIILVDKVLQGGSSNIAELWAVTEALLFAKSCKITDLDLYTDSRITIGWLKGHVGKKLNDRAAVMNLLTTINNLRTKIGMNATWVPREQNVAGVFIERNPHEAL